MRKTVLVLASMALAMVVLGGVAWAANIDCRTAGHESRFGYWRCVGTPHADTIFGTVKNESMSGKGGGDTMYGRIGHDSLYGNNGPDKVYGGNGNDFITGELGSDKLYGDEKHDRIFVTKEAPGPDFSDDYVDAGQGVDTIRSASDGPSTNYTQRGVDHIYGGVDNDFIVVSGNDGPGDSAVDIVSCGPDIDWVFYNEGVDIVDDTCEAKRPQ